MEFRPNQLNLPLARQRREEGVFLVASKQTNAQWIEAARNAAIVIATKRGVVWADLVYLYLRKNAENYRQSIAFPNFDPEPPTPNCYGAAFQAAARSGAIKSTDRVRKSRKVKRHSGVQLIWVKAR